MGERHSAQLVVLQGSMDTHQHHCLPKLSCFCLVLPVPLTSLSLLILVLIPSFFLIIPGTRASCSPIFAQLVSVFHCASNTPVSQSQSYHILHRLLPQPTRLISSVLFTKGVLCGQYVRRLLALLPSYSNKSLSLDNIFKYGLISTQAEDPSDHYCRRDCKLDQMRKVISRFKESNTRLFKFLQFGAIC